MATINVNYYLSTKPDKKGLRLILLYYSYAGKRFCVSTKKSVSESQWDDKQKRIKSSYTGAMQSNAWLSNIRTEVERVFEFGNTSSLPVAEQVKNVIKSFQPVMVAAVETEAEIIIPKKNHDTLFDWVENFIATAPRKRLTLVKYKGTMAYLRKFQAEVWNGRDIDFNDINIDFYNSFSRFLEVTHKLALNSWGSHIKNIKAWMNEAFEQEKHSNLRYKTKGFKVVSETSDSIYLSEEEIKKIYGLDLSAKPNYELVRDVFIIGCHTALRYSDLHQVKMENIQNDILKIRSVKTESFVEIAIHKTVKDILAKYGNVLPKIITNQKFNQHLHVIAKLAGLDQVISKSITKAGDCKPENFFKYELVTAHTARRSAATNLYLDGVPTLVIMALTGHKTERAFMKYIKVSMTQQAERLKDHYKQMENRKSQSVAS